jgi:hypothetical protein
LSKPRFETICAVHNNSCCRLGRLSVTVMLSFIVFFARRKRGFVWMPALDLSDPQVAAALVPMMNS